MHPLRRSLRRLNIYNRAYGGVFWGASVSATRQHSLLQPQQQEESSQALKDPIDKQIFRFPGDPPLPSCCHEDCSLNGGPANALLYHLAHSQTTKCITEHPTVDAFGAVTTSTPQRIEVGVDALVDISSEDLGMASLKKHEECCTEAVAQAGNIYQQDSTIEFIASKRKEETKLCEDIVTPNTKSEPSAIDACNIIQLGIWKSMEGNLIAAPTECTDTILQGMGKGLDTVTGVLAAGSCFEKGQEVICNIQHIEKRKITETKDRQVGMEHVEGSCVKFMMHLEEEEEEPSQSSGLEHQPGVYEDRQVSYLGVDVSLGGLNAREREKQASLLEHGRAAPSLGQAKEVLMMDKEKKAFNEASSSSRWREGRPMVCSDFEADTLVQSSFIKGGHVTTVTPVEMIERGADGDGASAHKVHCPLRNFGDIYIILDLNGVLIKRWDKKPSIPGVCKLNKRWIQLRPGCIEFLHRAFSSFRVGIWTTMRQENLVGMCKLLEKHAQRSLPFFMLWSKSCCYQNDCIRRPTNPRVIADFKPLSHVWASFNPHLHVHNTVLVDDSPYKACMNNPYNCIFPEPFEGSTEDNFLNCVLWPYLEGLRISRNIHAYIANDRLGQQPLVAGHDLYHHVRPVIDVFDYHLKSSHKC